MLETMDDVDTAGARPGALIVLHTVSLMVRRMRGVPIRSSIDTEM